MEEGRALLLDDALDSERFRANPSVQRLALRSVLCAPLIASSEAFALIYLENRDVAQRFTDDHRCLLQEIAALAAPRLRVAVAMEQARSRARELDSALGDTDGIVTADAGMAAMLETLRRIASTDLPVMIQILCGVTLKIPPLRERRQDIFLLAGHFLAGWTRFHKFSP